MHVAEPVPHWNTSRTTGPVHKVTPSMLAYLWNSCRRCFWLKARRGLHQPRMPFPKVFEQYHGLLQRYLLGRCPSELSPDLPPGRFVGGELWVKSRPLHLPETDASLFILGRLDHLAQFDDGSWGIIDIKTTRIGTLQVAAYARQLHAYTWALERAAPDAIRRTPVSRLGLFCLDPVQVATLEADARVLAELRPTWVEIPRRDDAYEAFLSRVALLIAQPEPPDAASDCSCCTYHTRRGRIHL